MRQLHKTLKKDLKDLKKLDTQTKIYLIIFMILVFVAAILTGSSLTNSRPANENGSESSNEAPAATEKPTTTLSLSPAAQNLKVGEVANISVILSKTPAQSADIVLTYDPKIFSPSNVRNGTLMPNVLNQKLEQGKLTFSASVDPSNAKNTLTGEIFSFSLRALAPATSSAVEFDKTLTITSANGENTLGLAVGGSYTVSY